MSLISKFERGWPHYKRDEVDALAMVLGADEQDIGREVTAFEDDFAQYVGAPRAVAFANATLALEALLQVLAIAPGSDVLVQRRSYFACVSSVVRSGLRPVAVDVDYGSQNVTRDILRRMLAPETGTIMIVDMAGWPSDSRAIREVADEYGIPVVADCAQALGARSVNGTTAEHATAAACSFCHDEMISTCGEGGMVATTEAAIVDRLRVWRAHGKSDAVEVAPGFAPKHWSVGTNGRLTDAQAAVGRVQLRKLDGWIRVRERNATLISKCVSEFEELSHPKPEVGLVHSFYKYYLFIRPEFPSLLARWDELLVTLRKSDVPAFEGACSDVFVEPAAIDLGVEIGDCPNSEILARSSIGLLVRHRITSEEMALICTRLSDVLREWRADDSGGYSESVDQ